MTKAMYKLAFCSALIGAGLCTATPVQDQSAAPDNTKANKTDTNSTTPTADKAKNGASDREIMKQIRHDVVNDKSLSTYGHNVKIISQHGKVTLKGPVHTEDEKTAIAGFAQKYAGDGNVDNQLTVKGDQK
jgi:hyperosmotically inducible periplasmic protein